MESKNNGYTVLYVEICNKYDSLLKINDRHKAIQLLYVSYMNPAIITISVRHPKYTILYVSLFHKK